MGFRSNFITEDLYGIIPQWFLDKYPNYTYHTYEDKKSFPLAQLYETKFYSDVNETEKFLDIQKVLKEGKDMPDDIIVILLHECGGITRVTITKDAITAREPVNWKDVENVTHSYCYGCSDGPSVNRVINAEWSPEEQKKLK